MSRDGFIEVLVEAGSPAAPVAGEIYDLFEEGGLDPAVGLAFFQHESRFGMSGVATRTHNWGNLRWAPVKRDYADYVEYDSAGNAIWAYFIHRGEESQAWEWYRSANAWRRLIAEVYLGDWGVPPYVEDILTKYAPLEDGNWPPGYVAAVKAAVSGWSQRYPPGPTLEDRVEALERRVAVLEGGE